MRRDYHQQFLISRQSAKVPPDWQRVELGGWFLFHCPNLPVMRVQDRSGDDFGVLIGHVFDLKGTLKTNVVTMVSGTADCEAHIHEFVRSLTGRFVLAVMNRSFSRVYPDAAANLATVFSPKTAQVASTPSLLLFDEPTNPIFRKTPDEFPCGGPEYFYPAGLTPDTEVIRVLPNHFLDLNFLTLKRFAYGNNIRQVNEDEAAISVGEITNLVRNNIKGIVEKFHPTYMSLTAGSDTRMLLACARQYIESIEFVTFDYTSWHHHRNHTIDTNTATLIANKFKLRHKIIPIRSAVERDVEKWYLRQMGYAAGAYKARDWLLACEDQLDLAGAWIHGFSGEIVRGGLYWREHDSTTGKISPKELLVRMGIPLDDRFVDAVSEWLLRLDGRKLSEILDIAYIEQRLGCLVSPRLYGVAQFQFNAVPFANPALYDRALYLPINYRRSRAVRDLIRRAWPELLDIRINDHARFLDRVVERTKWKWRSIKRVAGVQHFR